MDLKTTNRREGFSNVILKLQQLEKVHDLCESKEYLEKQYKLVGILNKRDTVGGFVTPIFSDVQKFDKGCLVRNALYFQVIDEKTDKEKFFVNLKEFSKSEMPIEKIQLLDEMSDEKLNVITLQDKPIYAFQTEKAKAIKIGTYCEMRNYLKSYKAKDGLSEEVSQAIDAFLNLESNNIRKRLEASLREAFPNASKYSIKKKLNDIMEAAAGYGPHVEVYVQRKQNEILKVGVISRDGIYRYYLMTEAGKELEKAKSQN